MSHVWHMCRVQALVSPDLVSGPLNTNMAEGEGFEPPEAHHLGCFQDSCHQPDSAIPPRPRSVSLPRHRRPSPRDPTLTASGKTVHCLSERDLSSRHSGLVWEAVS